MFPQWPGRVSGWLYAFMEWLIATICLIAVIMASSPRRLGEDKQAGPRTYNWPSMAPVSHFPFSDNERHTSKRVYIDIVMVSGQWTGSQSPFVSIKLIAFNGHKTSAFWSCLSNWVWTAFPPLCHWGNPFDRLFLFMCLAGLLHFGYTRGIPAGERVRISSEIILGFVTCWDSVQIFPCLGKC